MHWITIILIGLAANLDNLGIGLAYGVKQTKIPLASNITIAVVSMIMTYISVSIGHAMLHYISPHKANLLGSFLLCAIGIYTILSEHFSRTNSVENLEGIDRDKNNIISVKEAIILGFILSINCLASGIAIGANGISVIWTVISIGVFSVLTFVVGGKFGLLLSQTFIGKYSTAISGMMLIFIGVFEMFI